MTTTFVKVWNRRTGRKLKHPVPVSHLRLFPHLSETPTSRRRRQAAESAATPKPRRV